MQSGSGRNVLPTEGTMSTTVKTTSTETASRTKGQNNKGVAAAGTLPSVLICPGIGIGTSHNQNTPEIMPEEIRLARAAGANGVIFFSGGSLTAPFLEKLKSEAP